MTDKEIKKALECCACMHKNGCNECPMVWKKNETYSCTVEVSKSALEYINRLKDEITGLTGAWQAAITDKENLERTLEEANEELEKVRQETAKEILQSLHYEIEREKCASSLYTDFNDGLDTALNKVEYLAEKYEVEIEK